MDTKDSFSNDAAQTPSPKNTRIRVKALFFFIAVTLITLAFGLVPHDNYSEKWVSESELKGESIQFGHYGLAHGTFPPIREVHGNDHYLDIKLSVVLSKPDTNSFQVLAYLGTLDDENPLIIGQWDTFVIILQGYDFSNENDLPRLTGNIEDWFDKPLDLRILLNDSRNTLYANDTPVSVHSPSSYSLEYPNRILALGNTLNGKNGWSGRIKNFSVSTYNSVTTEVVSAVDYDFSEISADQRIQDKAQTGAHLQIPPVGEFPDMIFLNNRSLQDLLDSSPFDIFINLVGFIPIALATAFFLTSIFTSVPWWIVVPITSVIGVSVSLAIEYKQQWLPGRNSDLHDLILNTSGVILGLVVFYVIRLYRQRKNNTLELQQIES